MGFLSKLMKNPLVQMALPMALTYAAGPAAGALSGKFGLFKGIHGAKEIRKFLAGIDLVQDPIGQFEKVIIDSGIFWDLIIETIEKNKNKL